MSQIVKRRTAAGFTLIESMIAMFFLTLMVAELGSVMVFASRNSNLSQRMTRANALADEAIEKSRNTAYPSLQLPIDALAENCTLTGFVAECISHPDNGRFERKRIVTPLDAAIPPDLNDSSHFTDLPLSFMVSVDVRVTFTDSRGNPQDLRVASLVSRH